MKYLDKIEDYLNDNLSQQDRIDFEIECQTNESLASDLAFYLQTKQAFTNQKQQQFKQRYKTNQTKNPPTIKRFVWIAASAAAVVLLLLFGWSLFNNYQPEQQLAQIETHVYFFNNQITRSEDTLINTQKIWQDALAATKNKQYKQAIQSADSLNTKQAIGLKAFCYFELKDYDNAAITYETYLSQKPEYYERLRAKWNLALTYRLLENFDAEKRILNQIDSKGKQDLLKILK